ncbi:MAG: bifunctional 4-hydroxy-2-oxoglutarate aldolase/2-dehydro-3-deoxy-phosphogluconate aldolase [Rhodobacter sp.]|nr:bifunctional 4-hydroxy-2-oxoglutarate aldolase/2-dehydro-3-deoxy-phosphogluconate aldolase [Rhodobacter sp.]
MRGDLTVDGLEKRVTKLRIVPVVVLEDANDALPLCDALMAGGLPIAEVTFRTEAAAEAIALIRKERSDILVGAGTVLTSEHVFRAADVGAAFVVTPGFNPKVVSAAFECGLSIIPGVNSPTQVEMAMASGCRLLKFFPAAASGGLAMLKALSGPYKDVRFVPTGGVNPENLAEYLSLDNVAACGGSWMVEKELIADKDFESVVKLVCQATEIVRTVPLPPNS